MTPAAASALDNPAAPLGARVALLAVLGLTGLAVGITGYLGWQGRLTRNRYFGVRTAASLRSDEAFGLANRVAGLPIAVAGLVGLVGGVAAFAVPTLTGTVVVAGIGVVGMAALALAGGVLGHRAAETVPAAAPAGCGGCACGSGGCATLAALGGAQ